MITGRDPVRVLVVEDEHLVSQLIQQQLHNLGYSVCGTAFDGPEAVERTAQLSPDVVLMDVQMPDPASGRMDNKAGLRAAATIRERCPVPLILLTAHESPELVRQASLNGVSAYLVKPPKESELDRVIAIARARHEDLVEQQRLNAALKAEIRERERVEKELRIKEAAIATSINGIALADMTGQLSYVNDALLEMWGYADRSEAMGLPVLAFWQSSREMVHVGRMLRRNGQWFGDMVARRKDGTTFDAQISAHVVRDLDGEPTCMMAAVVDISDRKLAQASIVQASRMEATATLAAGLAHDLNNSMSSVLGYAELLKTELRRNHSGMNTDRMWKMLDAVSGSAREASALVRQLLAFARKGQYEKRVLDLNAVVERAVRAQEAELPPGIHIVRALDADLWTVEADPTQMGQVVGSLLSNAVEAIEGRGTVTIRTHNQTSPEGGELSAGRYIVLSVQDTGRGMPAPVQARIFEPFFSTKFLGRGMGLAAVYGIVDRQGGRIEVTSAVGMGSTFDVWLPALPAEEAVLAPEPRDRDDREVVHTILVIEGDRAVRGVTEHMLTRLGYRALAYASIVEAAGPVHDFGEAIRVALIDTRALTKGWRQRYNPLARAHPEMSMLLSCSYGLDAAERALIETGAVGYVQKPYKIDQLALKVRQALEN